MDLWRGRSLTSRYGPRKGRFNGATGARGLGRALLVAALLVAVPVGKAGAAAATLRILALGDSLTAGFGLAESESFPAQLERRLRDQGYDVQVINGGVSGDTTADGLARLDWALADDPDVVIVSLGANDGLRAVDPATTRANLDRIVGRMVSEKKRVLLAGMYAPPNLGHEYGARFNAIYPDLARQYDVALYPFFLEGVATDATLNQADGMHPNAAGVAVIVSGIAPYVERLLGKAG